MKKIFITLLFAILSIGSSMAAIVNDEVKVEPTSTNGIYEVTCLVDSASEHYDWTIEVSLCVYNEETLNTFKTTTDFDERVATLSNMCVSTLRINIENKNYWKESNNIVELLIGTDNILAHGVNTYIAYKDVFYSDYSQHWKKDNYQSFHVCLNALLIYEHS